MAVLKMANEQTVNAPQPSPEDSRRNAELNKQLVRQRQDEIMKYGKMLPEEVLKVIIAIILAILFVLLFISVIWYFLIQMDTTIADVFGSSPESAQAMARFLL